MQIIKKCFTVDNSIFINSFFSPGEGARRTNGDVVLQSEYPTVFAGVGHTYKKFNKLTEVDMPTNNGQIARGMAYNPTSDVILCLSYSKDYFHKSEDGGDSWTSEAIPRGAYGNNAYTSLKFVNNKFFAFCTNADNNTRCMKVSDDDGDTWVEYVLPATSYNYYDIEYLDGTYVIATLSDCNIHYSDDLTNWTTVSLGYGSNGGFVSSLSILDNRFVVCRSNEAFYHCSEDGINWTTKYNNLRVVSSYGYKLFNNRLYRMSLNDDNYLLRRSSIDGFEEITVMAMNDVPCNSPVQPNNYLYWAYSYKLMYLDEFDNLTTCSIPTTPASSLPINLFHAPTIEVDRRILFVYFNKCIIVDDEYNPSTHFRLPDIKNGWIMPG